jgi:hypothetical protein
MHMRVVVKLIDPASVIHGFFDLNGDLSLEVMYPNLPLSESASSATSGGTSPTTGKSAQQL